MIDLSKFKIAIIGLGYVGLPLAVEFGKKYKTIGYDISLNRINELSAYKDGTNEVSQQQIKAAKKLKFSSTLDDLANVDIYIITVPTPIDDSNNPNLEPLKKASESVGKIISKNSIVIYESTVYPGCTEEFCIPILESNSGLEHGKDFFCGYSPERINPGDKVNTLTKITKIVSGCDISTTELIAELYESIIDAGVFKTSSIKVAEAAKVIENTQRDLNIAFVNELSIIFKSLDIDTIEVLEAAGSKWNFMHFRPGMVGGHCIGVDPYYLTYKSQQVGYIPQVILSGRRINENMAKFTASSILKLMSKNKIDISTARVGVFGFTFKENCPDIRNTKVISLVDELKRWNVDVLVNDPWANAEEVKNLYDIKLTNQKDMNKLDAIIVAVGHDEYRNINLNLFKDIVSSKNPVFGDIKSIYKKQNLEKLGFEVFRL